jgi:AraC family transcriptional regulator
MSASPEILAHLKTADGLAIQLRRDPVGILEVPALENVIVGIHLGAPTRLECHRAGKRFIGTAVPGDINIIPSGTPSRWEVFDGDDTALFLSVPKHLISAIASESGIDPARVEIRNRFNIRDRELEVIASAIKKELELGSPSGRLYLGGLALAVASRLVVCHSSFTSPPGWKSEGLSDRRLKGVLTFIEDRLAEDLSLGQIAAVAGISSSHLKTVFAKSLGTPVHQYVIQRRVERAKELLTRTDLSITEIALAAGFAHQSHLARHMRRLLGESPRALRQALRGKRTA